MWSNKPFSTIDAIVKPPVVVVVHLGTGFYRCCCPFGYGLLSIHGDEGEGQHSAIISLSALDRGGKGSEGALSMERGGSLVEWQCCHTTTDSDCRPTRSGMGSTKRKLLVNAASHVGSRVSPKWTIIRLKLHRSLTA